MYPRLYFLFLLFSLSSCEQSSEISAEEPIRTMRIDYYSSSCSGAFFVQNCLNFQIDDEIGSDQWRTQAISIEGFEFNYGYVYDLEVKITPIDISNCADDCPDNRYELVRMVSKSKVENPCVIASNPDQACTKEYMPVCGCNKRTYSNSCVAAVSGITTWTLGACD